MGCFVSRDFTGINQCLCEIADSIVCLFFLDFGDGLVAVNFAAFFEGYVIPLCCLEYRVF
jgi:hypothetical protein